MTDKQLEKLAAQWLALHESSEDDQWAMAETCHLAIEIEGEKPGVFAKLIGKTVAYVLSQRKAYAWQLENPSSDLDFGDAMVVANSSKEQAAALMVVADGKGLSNAKKRGAEIAMVREFFDTQPEMVEEVLKDDATRHAVNTAAFKAASKKLTDKQKAGKPDVLKPKVDKKLSMQERNMALEMDKAMVNFLHLERRTGREGSRIVQDLESAYHNQLFTDDKEAVLQELCDQMIESVEGWKARIEALGARRKAHELNKIVNG